MVCFQNGGCGGSVAGCCGNGAAGAMRNRCNMLGPIRAIDQNCLPPVTATGSIIPFASGIVPVALTSLVGGLVGTPFFIGFGSAVPGVILANTTINLTGLVNEAFTVPRSGSINSISATYTLTAALSLVGEAATVRAQIYRAPAGSTVFSPTDAFVNLSPPLTSLLTIGTTLSGTAAPAVPVAVAPGDRLLMVYTLSGTTLASAAAGTASAGISIAEA